MNNAHRIARFVLLSSYSEIPAEWQNLSESSKRRRGATSFWNVVIDHDRCPDYPPLQWQSESKRKIGRRRIVALLDFTTRQVVRETFHRNGSSLPSK